MSAYETAFQTAKQNQDICTSRRLDASFEESVTQAHLAFGQITAVAGMSIVKEAQELTAAIAKSKGATENYAMTYRVVRGA